MSQYYAKLNNQFGLQEARRLPRVVDSFRVADDLSMYALPLAVNEKATFGDRSGYPSV